MNIKNKKTLGKGRAQLLLSISLSCMPIAQLFAPPITCTVTTTADSGPGSLRQCIINTNANVGFTNTINFAIFGTITPITDLPTITNPLIIDGYTAPGSAPNTNPITAANNAIITIEIQGPGAGADLVAPLNGLVLDVGSDGSTIQGLCINNFANVLSPGSIYGAGILVLSSHNTIRGNFIGSDVTGTISLPNATAVRVQGDFNLIGVSGSDESARNLLSGHYLGGSGGAARRNGVVRISGSDTTVSKNTIGLDRSGTLELMDSSRVGVLTTGSGFTLIGGVDHLFSGNVISGNRAGNIVLEGITSSQTIDHNYIGTDVSGTLAVEGNGNGIIVNRNFLGNAFLRIKIDSNLISGNTHGVEVGSAGFSSFPIIGTEITSNLIGTDAAGTGSIPNSLDGVWVKFARNTLIGINTISNNGGNGIRVGKAKNTQISSNTINNNGFNGIQLGGVVTAGVPAFGDIIGGAKPTEGNTISGNGFNGIELVSFTREETIMGNTITDNGRYGILVNPYGGTNYIGTFRDAGDNRLVGPLSTQQNTNLGPLGTSNLITGNPLGGIRLVQSNHNTMATNIIQNNGGNGITEEDASFNLVGGKVGAQATTEPPVLGNIITNNDGFGVQVIQNVGNATDDTIISNQICNNASNGIKLTTL